MLADLVVLRIINEPTAAGLAYGMDKVEKAEDKNCIVFDLGGGTFDVTTLVLDEGIMQVHSTKGDTHLGGEDFDQEVVNYCVNKFETDSGTDIKGDAKVMRKLKLEVEKAKKIISVANATDIVLDIGEESLDMNLTREKFQFLNKKHFDKIIPIVEKCLEEAKLKR